MTDRQLFDSLPRDDAADMIPLTWRELRALCLYRDSYTCRFCGGIGLEADHIIPRAFGGPDLLSNLQTLCRTCNAAKGIRIVPLESWLLVDLAAARAALLQLRAAIDVEAALIDGLHDRYGAQMADGRTLGEAIAGPA